MKKQELTREEQIAILEFFYPNNQGKSPGIFNEQNTQTINLNELSQNKPYAVVNFGLEMIMNRSKALLNSTRFNVAFKALLKSYDIMMCLSVSLVGLPLSIYLYILSDKIPPEKHFLDSNTHGFINSTNVTTSSPPNSYDTFIGQNAATVGSAVIFFFAILSSIITIEKISLLKVDKDAIETINQLIDFINPLLLSESIDKLSEEGDAKISFQEFGAKINEIIQAVKELQKTIRPTISENSLEISLNNLDSHLNETSIQELAINFLNQETYRRLEC